MVPLWYHLWLVRDDANVWFDFGVLYKARGQLVEAASANRKAVKVKPDFREACYNLGVVHGDQREFAAAIEAFQKAVRLRPDYVKAWLNLFVAHAIQGDSSQVMEGRKRLEALDTAKAAEFLKALSLPG